jgi:hypothetical protein
MTCRIATGYLVMDMWNMLRYFLPRIVIAIVSNREHDYRSLHDFPEMSFNLTTLEVKLLHFEVTRAP